MKIQLINPTNGTPPNNTPNNGTPTNNTRFEALEALNYTEIKEHDLNGNKLSMGLNKDGYSVDVYLNGKLCGNFTLSSGDRESGQIPKTHSFNEVDKPIVIGNKIYFKNGYDFIEIKD